MIKRTMMQMYVQGSGEAVSLYQQAFGAALVDAYPNDDGTYYHAELDAYGQIIAVAEADCEAVTGSTMQFCFHFGEGNEGLVEKAYNTLKEGGEVRVPLGPCEYSASMADVVDRFGVRWCLFV